nr:scarecrow-like protein 14 [Ipomoea batatas]
MAMDPRWVGWADSSFNLQRWIPQIQKNMHASSTSTWGFFWRKASMMNLQACSIALKVAENSHISPPSPHQKQQIRQQSSPNGDAYQRLAAIFGNAPRRITAAEYLQLYKPSKRFISRRVHKDFVLEENGDWFMQRYDGGEGIFAPALVGYLQAAA